MGLIDLSGIDDVGQLGYDSSTTDYNALNSMAGIDSYSQFGGYDYTSALTSALDNFSSGLNYDFGGFGSSSEDMIVSGSTPLDAEKSSNESWISKALSYFDKHDKQGAAAMTLAGSFVQGLFSASSKERQTKAMEKSAEASMMNAQVNAEKLANGSAIGKTTFGAKKPKPQTSYNLLAERQQRAGYTGRA